MKKSIKQKYLFIVFFWFILLICKPDFTAAQVYGNATIPTYHWVQEYLSELQLRSPQNRLFIATRPLSTNLIKSSLAESADKNSFFETHLRGFLLRIDRKETTQDQTQMLYIDGLSSGRAGRIEEDLRSRLSQRIGGGLNFSPKFSIHNTINLDEALRDDPSYTGKKWRGFAAITEQAYAIMNYNRFSIKFGRDYVRWGRGEDATLLISDNSLPFDQLQLQFRTKRLQFTYFTAKLNPFRISDTLNVANVPMLLNRYLSAGRVDFSFFDNKLQFSLSQAVIYGRQGGFEWHYLNPFLVYHGEVVNNNEGGANSFGSFDFAFYPRAGFELYGELLIDDIQVEETSAVDLEPGEFGYIIGTRMADFLNLAGVTAGIEYSKIKNRTYNSPVFFEKFTHHNRSIGHFLGNDFDRWLIFARKYFGNQLRLQLQADFRRHGQGRVDALWDTPWLDFTLAEGYSEPFPTGIVEKTQYFSVDLRWHPKESWYVEFAGNYTRWENYLNVAGEEKSRTEFFLRIWIEWMKLLRI